MARDDNEEPGILTALHRSDATPREMQVRLGALASHANPARLAYLDGLRGWLALSVLLLHIIDTYTMAGARGFWTDALLHVSHTPLRTLYDGNLAVAVFFIMSAIALTAAVDGARIRPTLLGLLAKRYVRLAIPVLVTSGLSLCYILSGLDYRAELDAVLRNGAYILHPFEAGVSGWLKESLLGTFLPLGSNDYNLVLWTMRYEMAGSILVFILALALPSGLPRLAGALSLTLLCVSIGGGYGGALWLFLIGIALYELRAPLADRRLQWLGVALFVAALVNAGNSIESFWTGALGLDIADQRRIRAVALVAGVLMSWELRTLLTCRLSLWLGRISFPLYLFHAPLLWSVGGWLYFSMLTSLGHHCSAILAGAAVAALSLAGAHLLAIFVDQPALAYSRRVERLVSAFALRGRVPAATGQKPSALSPLAPTSALSA
jgi:peptidoglycan/LPS O-acetylase OafA/YrhL